ncbi:MAG: helix-turn-helix domain-containing protein [Huintestinicola sp.]|uniref:helix-turn-helix domain-containing protein n=1 Tax=Huintestinicola sp. TaxID=2981661 RepID=UPI003F0D51D9
MKLGTIGYNYSHDSDFVMNRPNGPGCWLMLIVKTPAQFEVNGKSYTVRENSFVIISPDAPCRYCAAGDRYTDDWIYFSADEETVRRFDELGIPINEPVYLGDTESVSHIVHILAFEHYCAEPFHLEIEEHYTEILLLSVSRLIRSGAHISSKMFIEKNHRMTQLRTALHTDPEKALSIDEMAASVNMSRSGFQHLYKKMFGVSVINDVINGRLERAKRLLSSTELTVAEIAAKCGYATEYNFMRQFKSRTGKTPTEYRRQI